MRLVAVLMLNTHDSMMPSKQVVREAQQTSRAASGASGSSFTVKVGKVVEDDEGLCRVMLGGRNVLWIPDDARDLQVRLTVCVHMKEAGHRG